MNKLLERVYISMILSYLTYLLSSNISMNIYNSKLNLCNSAIVVTLYLNITVVYQGTINSAYKNQDFIFFLRNKKLTYQ